MEIKKFKVTVRRFDPTGSGEGEEFVLPVDSPDAEHAASSVLANLISWTPKTSGGTILPVAFRCIDVAERTA